MTNWRTAKPSPHLAAADLDGKDMDVVVTSVVQGEVEGENGRKENCNIATISVAGKQCRKTLVLNTTNCKTLAKLSNSNQIESWVNIPITLYPTTTKLKRDIVDCIRIRQNKEA